MYNKIMVTAQNLVKKFGNEIALDGLSLNISPGEFVFLTGPSGSGKTTFIKLILREYKPTSGDIVVGEKSLNKISSGKIHEVRRQIGMIFQDFRLIEELSVWENIAVPLEITWTKQSEIAAAVKIALEMVGMAGQGHLFPAQLSGGEIQRVAIARAIVSKPKLILADEPTGNLDPKTSHQIVKLLKDLHEQLKTTVIMSTHNADIVNHYAQRVISLEKGKLAKDIAGGKYE